MKGVSVHWVLADLDGDGSLDFLIKQPQSWVDPFVPDWRRSTDTLKIEAYRHDGTPLWRHDLGWSIEAGLWYSPYVVYDLAGRLPHPRSGSGSRRGIGYSVAAAWLRGPRPPTPATAVLPGSKPADLGSQHLGRCHWRHGPQGRYISLTAPRELPPDNPTIRLPWGVKHVTEEEDGIRDLSG